MRDEHDLDLPDAGDPVLVRHRDGTTSPAIWAHITGTGTALVEIVDGEREPLPLEVSLRTGFGDTGEFRDVDWDEVIDVRTGMLVSDIAAQLNGEL
jgi:hypothetical protein